MVFDRADVPAVRHPDHDGHRQRAVVTHGEPRELRGDLVEGGEDEAVELDLDDWAIPPHGEPDRGADDARLGERRVEHAVVAELGREPLGHPEDTAERPDVLTHEDHPVVGPHGLAEPGVDGLRHRQGPHAAHASFGMLDGVGHDLLLLGARGHDVPPSNPAS